MSCSTRGEGASRHRRERGESHTSRRVLRDRRFAAGINHPSASFRWILRHKTRSWSNSPNTVWPATTHQQLVQSSKQKTKNGLKIPTTTFKRHKAGGESAHRRKHRLAPSPPPPPERDFLLGNEKQLRAAPLTKSINRGRTSATRPKAFGFRPAKADSSLFCTAQQRVAISSGSSSSSSTPWVQLTGSSMIAIITCATFRASIGWMRFCPSFTCFVQQRRKRRDGVHRGEGGGGGCTPDDAGAYRAMQPFYKHEASCWPPCLLAFPHTHVYHEFVEHPGQGRGEGYASTFAKRSSGNLRHYALSVLQNTQTIALAEAKNKKSERGKARWPCLRSPCTDNTDNIYI